MIIFEFLFTFGKIMYRNNGDLTILVGISSVPFIFFVVTTFPQMLPAWREEHYDGLYRVFLGF